MDNVDVPVRPINAEMQKKMEEMEKLKAEAEAKKAEDDAKLKRIQDYIKSEGIGNFILVGQLIGTDTGVTQITNEKLDLVLAMGMLEFTASRFRNFIR